MNLTAGIWRWTGWCQDFFVFYIEFLYMPYGHHWTLSLVLTVSLSLMNLLLWYTWKIAKLVLNNNHSFTHSYQLHYCIWTIWKKNCQDYLLDGLLQSCFSVFNSKIWNDCHNRKYSYIPKNVLQILYPKQTWGECFMDGLLQRFIIHKFVEQIYDKMLLHILYQSFFYWCICVVCQANK